MVYNSSYGFAQSPNFPHNYPISVRCHYLIKRKDPKERITIEFLQFSLEQHSLCSHDFIKIYDGDSVNSRVVYTGARIIKYCGPCSPPILKSTGNSLLIVFISNKIVTSTGFNFTYRGKLFFRIFISVTTHY